MKLDDAIQGRRSIRQYTGKEVPEEFIRQVIEAATFAPSARMVNSGVSQCLLDLQRID